jgi:riboflavin synthase
MFTGLVEAVGQIVERQAQSGGARVRIGTPLAPELAPGDSVAVNGVCLTVIATEASEIQADLGPETLRVTTLGSLDRGALVNLERPLRADSRFGGHFVQGHVDGRGRVAALRREGEGARLRLQLGPELQRYCVEKGSLAVDGVSLTIAALDDEGVEIALVPFTLEHTTLGALGPGDEVNVEVDLLAKYAERLASA